MPPLHLDDSLSRGLATWRIKPPRDPGFRSAVWTQIAAARRPSNWTKFARAHAPLVSALLFGAIIAGAWTGTSEAQQRTQADRRAIAASYVHSLDARWMRHP